MARPQSITPEWFPTEEGLWTHPKSLTSTHAENLNFYTCMLASPQKKVGGHTGKAPRIHIQKTSTSTHVSSNVLQVFGCGIATVEINEERSLEANTQNRPEDGTCTLCCALDSVSNLKFVKLRSGFWTVLLNPTLPNSSWKPDPLYWAFPFIPTTI